MSNLKDLVPPLELCKLIPAGEFEESFFVLVRDSFNQYFAVRNDVCADYPGYIYPAPTLKEIMSELSLCDVYCDTGWFCKVSDPDDWSIGNCECDLYVRNGTESDSPEAAALKVWLKLKGIEA